MGVRTRLAALTALAALLLPSAAGAAPETLTQALRHEQCSQTARAGLSACHTEARAGAATGIVRVETGVTSPLGGQLPGDGWSLSTAGLYGEVPRPAGGAATTVTVTIAIDDATIAGWPGVRGSHTGWANATLVVRPLGCDCSPEMAHVEILDLRSGRDTAAGAVVLTLTAEPGSGPLGITVSLTASSGLTADTGWTFTTLEASVTADVAAA